MRKRHALIWFFTAIVFDAGFALSSSVSPGTLDSSFVSPMVNGSILSIAVQEDGHILIGGNFTQVQQVARPGLARLNTDGSLDTSFVPLIELCSGITNVMKQVILEPDGTFLGAQYIGAQSIWMDANGLPMGTWAGPILGQVLVEQLDGNILSATDRKLIRIYGPDRTMKTPALIKGPDRTVIKAARTPDFVVLNVQATGYPLCYQWFRNGETLPGATNSTLDVTGQTGRYQVQISNQLGSVNSTEIGVGIATIPEALNTPTWSYTMTSGWSVNLNDSHDGFACVSGYPYKQFTSDLQPSVASLSTVKDGPGEISFWSKGPGMVFQVDELVFELRFAGDNSWHQSLYIVPAGQHQLRWWNPAAVGPFVGQSELLLDQVNWIPHAPGMPPFALQTTNLTAPAGEVIRIQASSQLAAPAAFQWWFATYNPTNLYGGFQLPTPGLVPLTALAGATNLELVLPYVTLTSAGYYLLTASNSLGVTASPLVHLTVNGPDRPRLLPVRSGWRVPFQFDLLGAQGSNYAVLVSSDLISWQLYTNLSLTASPFRVLDLTSTNLPCRFYRVGPP
jgi:hypothetical protein